MNKIKKIIPTFVSGLMALLLVLLPVIPAAAETITDLNSAKSNLQNKLKQNQAQQAAKAKEQAEIANQLNAISGQISQTSQAINNTSNQISSTRKTISDLEAAIKAQEEALAKEQDKMGQVVASWYMQGEAGLLEAMLSADNISELIDNQQYYDSIRQQIVGAMEQIDKTKADLNKQKDEQNRQLASLSELEKTQTEQKNYLDSRKSFQSSLMNNSKEALGDLKTEEQQTQTLIADINSRIDKIRSMSVGANGDLVSAVDSSWYYRQDDSKWADHKIGRYATIGQVGCLITSLTMIAKYYGKSYTPESASDVSSFITGGRYDGSLLSTPIVSDGKAQTIDWATVDQELLQNHPVVVGLALGVDMGNSYSVSHWIVVKSKLSNGKYGIHDPLGENKGYRLNQVAAMRIIR